MGQCFQPYEAHIPFYLQFMIDYNVNGMGFVHFDDVRFRPDSESRGILYIVFPACSQRLDDDIKLLSWGQEWDAKKQSRCELELDSTVISMLHSAM
jgi:DNA polymerase zeta